MLKSRLTVLLAAAVLPLAGCGDSGSSSNSGADPAKVVPAGAPVYFEATVRPDGDVRSGAEDALKKLLRTDNPGERAVQLFDQAAKKAGVSWDEVKQWLGPRVGVYVLDVQGGTPVVALIADQTDPDMAKATLDKLSSQKSSPDTASAIVGDYAVVGTPAGVQAVQAAAKGGRTLADSTDYQAARDAVSADDGLVTGYVDTQKALDLVSRMQPVSAPTGTGANASVDPQQLAGVLKQFAAKAGRAAALSVHATGDAISVKAASIGAPAGAQSPAADNVAALPADAWLAVGFGDLGKAVTDALAQIGQLANAAGNGMTPNFDAIFKRFEKKTGINVQRDFLSWMGDGAIYARGRSIADIGGVLTIKAKDGAKAKKAVGILAQGLARSGMNSRPAKIDGYDVAIELRSAQAPISFFIAANNDRFSIGVNPQAMSDVLDPSDKLGDSDTYSKASDTLGDGIKPYALVDLPTIISLVESFGVSQQPGYEKVKPYLDALGPLSMGSARDGDVSRWSMALGLR